MYGMPSFTTLAYSSKVSKMHLKGISEDMTRVPKRPTILVG